MNQDSLFALPSWTQLSNYVQSNSIIKYSIEALSTHREKIVPLAIAAAFGGTLLYGINKRKNKPKQNYHAIGPIDILELPAEARRVIWSKLAYQDLLRLRLVSEFTKQDVDTMVGLKMKISSKYPEKYRYSRSIALQACIITDLTEEVGSDFFADPYLMNRLEIRERSSISLTNLMNVISPCINLTKLKLRFNYAAPISEISEIILNALHHMEVLTHLEIMKIPTQLVQEKSFPVDLPGVSFPCPKRITHLQIEIADISDDQVTGWRYVMEQQTKLRTLIVNIGAVQWEYFRRVLVNNSNLERVGMQNLKSYGVDSPEEIPFDWGVFMNCSQISCLDLTCGQTSGPRGADCMNSINFGMMPCSEMEEFHVSRIILSPEAVQKIYREMPRLQRGSLDHIGPLGVARANELAWLFHRQQEIERDNWFSRVRFWDALFHLTVGLAVMAIIAITSTSREVNGNDENLFESFLLP